MPLASGSHADARRPTRSRMEGSLPALGDGTTVGLAEPANSRGYRGGADAPTAILLVNNGLHIEIVIDRAHPVGRDDDAGIADVVLEAALTTIMDLEDSIAAVDPFDKVAAYRNWLGLCQGTLVETFQKHGKPLTRRLADDRVYTPPDGSGAHAPGPQPDADPQCRPPDDRRGRSRPRRRAVARRHPRCRVHQPHRAPRLARASAARNSRAGSIYIVKPKMHGPQEVAFANDLFAAVEDMLGLRRDTIKIGLMDEERRTTVNLKECIRAVKSRVFFINTGFLDRTGDEIHTAMEAGPMVRKNRHAHATLAQGLRGLERRYRSRLRTSRPCPDRQRHVGDARPDGGDARAERSGSSRPAPIPPGCRRRPRRRCTRRTITRSMSSAARRELASRPRARLDDILTVPVAHGVNWSPEEIQQELDNNAQGILGYVVRWIDQGVGCSKVPDINNVALMEDRATLRISSQHIANWLQHGITSERQVMDTLKRMAAVVDRQNAGDPAYPPMAPDFDESIAFAAACDLVFKGAAQPNGYTEPILHARRAELKRSKLAAK